ncbi:phosphoribosylformylglycinamidine synthase subunit PurS [Rickettsiales bacterium]|nr:phosphoribosylformylglycinamidine synthase subunit PurS [Rickettsiales bacterium]MDB2550846.1 phosphoribosylformylglycinamidine synthase subunit PurS [Rickettsiales bacterium]
MKKVKIHVKLKEGVLDIEGKTIENSLNHNLGFDQISEVRKGKLIEMNINETDPERINQTVQEICNKMLVNQVIEDYEIL